MKDYEVNSVELAATFGVSTRYIENLVAAGVITNSGTRKAYRFDLRMVVPEYATFLASGESLHNWCKDV